MKLPMLFLNMVSVIGSVSIYRSQILSNDLIYLLGWVAGIATMMILFDTVIILKSRK